MHEWVTVSADGKNFNWVHYLTVPGGRIYIFLTIVKDLDNKNIEQIPLQSCVFVPDAKE